MRFGVFVDRGRLPRTTDVNIDAHGHDDHDDASQGDHHRQAVYRDYYEELRRDEQDYHPEQDDDEQDFDDDEQDHNKQDDYDQDDYN